MPTRRRKSPRKISGMQPDYYGTDGDQDSPEITSGKAGAKPPSKKRHRIGYKEALKKKTAPARKNSSELLSESLAYEEESESDDKEKGLVIDISNKKWKVVVTRLGRTKDDDTDKTSPELAITKVQKRIFDDEVNDNDEEKRHQLRQ